VKRAFISDCEGPISKNDNAFEITASFVPSGGKLFTVISKYDDMLAGVVKKSGYSAGDTLKLILPFLKAFDVTDQKMRQFSARNLVLIRDSKETLQHVRGIADVFIISTSYEHYIHALCDALDFPFENTYCTKLNLDGFSLTEEEKKRLKVLAAEIAEMPLIQISESAKSVKDFSEKDQKTIARLEEIFWGELTSTCCGQLFSEVKPVGGVQKADSVQDVARKLHLPLSDVMYVGDSITDVEAFKLVRNNCGLTVSFNGNSYAVKEAEIAILSESSMVTAAIAEVFCQHGKQRALQLAKQWTRESLKGSTVREKLPEWFFGSFPRAVPKIQIVTAENRDALAKESSEFRKKVRGETVGRLG
jgi:energy-converting hydrogenase A subunit R